MHCYTPSPGDEHRQGEGLWGPVQWRRECGTLGEIGRSCRVSCASFIVSFVCFVVKHIYVLIN